MWRRWLLSVLLIPVVACGARAQPSFCEDEHKTDSIKSHIYATYSYLSPGYQAALDSFLRQCPDDANAWQMKAMPNIKMGAYEDCFRFLKNAVRLDPKTWLPYQAFLKCIFTKDYRGALVDFDACEKIFPGSGVMDHSFGFFRGLCYMGLGVDSLRKGLSLLEKDVADQRRHAGPHHVSLFYLGMAYSLVGEPRKAIKCYRECLEIYPQYPEPNFYLGILLQAYSTGGDAYLKKALEYVRQGYNSNEDQEFYVNYPYAVTAYEVEAQLRKK